MPKISIPLTEPTSAPHIYIDPKTNLVHVTVPVVYGKKFGLDNTCKAVYAPQEFFGKTRDAKAVSALSSLKSYQEALEFDIALLGEDSDLKVQKKARLEQVNLYIHFLEAVKNHSILKPLTLNFPEYPSPLKRLMAARDSNLYSMVLRPKAQDEYLRTINPVFSLQHKRLEAGHVINDVDSLFATTLLDCFQATPIHRKNIRTRLIAAVLEQEEKEGLPFDFERLRDHVCTEIKRFFPHEPVRFTKLNEQRQEEAISQAMIDTWMGEYSKPDTAEEYIDALLKYGIPDFFDNRDSPFDGIQTEDVPAEQRSSALVSSAWQLSFITQFFLGEAAIYCVSKGKTTVNWGELLDCNETLSKEMAAKLLPSVLSDSSIEQVLLDFINSHQGALGLKTALTEDDKKKITKQFQEHYIQIKDSPRLDEFMVVDTEKNGLFVTRSSYICTDLTEFIYAAIDEDSSLQDWNQFYFQRVRENFKNINGELAHHNTLYPGKEAELRFEIELDTLSDEQLRALIKRLNLEEQRKINALPEVQARLVLLDFLVLVAHGEQDQVDKLLTSYGEQGQDLQALLLKPGTFTDHSGRTFHCSAFEYAYWTKDIYMCRMLMKHMDKHTQAEMASRCETMDREGLAYTMDGVAFKSAHFDFTPLKEAYWTYLNEYHKTPKDWDVIDQAWLNIGMQQRLVPVHVANEYCHPTRSFIPTPSFLDESLPRSLAFYNRETDNNESWFPLADATGLGFKFAFRRIEGRLWGGPRSMMCGIKGLNFDLVAIGHLDKVRTEQLTELCTQLSQALDVRPSRR